MATGTVLVVLWMRAQRIQGAGAGCGGERAGVGVRGLPTFRLANLPTCRFVGKLASAGSAGAGLPGGKRKGEAVGGWIQSGGFSRARCGRQIQAGWFLVYPAGKGEERVAGSAGDGLAALGGGAAPPLLLS